MSSDEDPVLQLDLSNPQSPQLRLASAEDIPASRRAALEKLNSDAKHQARQERLLEVAARGAAPIAIADDPLPADVIARIILDRAAPDSRLIVVNEATFTDEVLQRTQDELGIYELSVPDSPERVELSLLSDGRVRVARGGKEGVYKHKVIASSPSGDRGYAKKILKRAEKAETSHLKGVGNARVVALSGKRGSTP